MFIINRKAAQYKNGWWSSPLSAQSNGAYVAKVEKPKQGWTAYMVELSFPSGVAQAPFKFTTGVKVLPDVLPTRGAQH